MATKVTLRKKPISGNRESLYLDFYPAIKNQKTGRTTRREFLNMFLHSEFEYEEQKYTDNKGKEQTRIIPATTKGGKEKVRRLDVFERQHNKNIQDIAEGIKIRRENELNKPLVYSELEREKLKSIETSEGSFIEYFKSVADQKSGSDHENWIRVYKCFKEFAKTDISFRDLDEKICNEFREHLLNLKAYKGESTITQNSASTYFVKFKNGVRQAFEDKKIPVNISLNLKTIPLINTQRNFLTLDELNKLVKTNCEDPLMKRAALFSALTGLRKSDILNLLWENVEIIDEQHALRFRQQKTKEPLTLFISEQAYDLMGEAGDPKDKVFKGLQLDSYHIRHIYRWLGEAGISKRISFHCFRHTFATLQLSLGTDIYTVSKLLGHQDVKTTQIYAKVVDKLKQDAANRIKLDL